MYVSNMLHNTYLIFVTTSCIIIVLCFQAISIDAIQKSYHHSAKYPKVPSKIIPHMYLLRDQKVNADVEEPGFDLSESEIRKFKIWPKGVIPFYIDTLSFSDKVLRDRIRNFLNNVNGLTNLNFVELPSPPKDENSRWVFFLNRRGQLKCADPHIKDFSNQGVQKVVLGYDCINNGGGLAEAVMALAGVPAQHNAPDRDDYIKVNMDNILPDKKYLFTKLKDDEWLFHDISYDFESATHYDLYRNSANGRATIDVLNGAPDIFDGESTTLSTRDIQKIRMLYNYISRKKSDLPECHKLFEPGVNFYKFNPKENILEPRKKPSKYLGVIEDENQDNDNVSEKINEDKPNNNSNESEVMHDTQNDNGDIQKDQNGNISSSRESLYLPRGKITLEQLSDYNTEEEYEKLKQKKSKLKFKPINW